MAGSTEVGAAPTLQVVRLREQIRAALGLPAIHLLPSQHDRDLANGKIDRIYKIVESTVLAERAQAERWFPIIAAYDRKKQRAHPMRIPWSVAEKAYSVYSARHGKDQSLERMAERGGFHLEEMDEYFPGWEAEASEIGRLRSALAAGAQGRIDEAVLAERAACAASSWEPQQTELAWHIARKINASTSGKDQVQVIAEALLAFPRETSTCRILAEPVAALDARSSARREPTGEDE
jgi:hypothetical protein